MTALEDLLKWKTSSISSTTFAFSFLNRGANWNLRSGTHQTLSKKVIQEYAQTRREYCLCILVMDAFSVEYWAHSCVGIGSCLFL